MKTKTITIITTLALSIMLFVANGFADIPAPPVNQNLGLLDIVLNDLTEAQCRECHDFDGGPSTPDRHHLLYGSPMIYGECPNGDPCLSAADCSGAGNECKGETAASDPYANTGVYGCLSCHEESTVGNVTNFLVERDCLVCHAQVPGEASVHHLTATAQGTLPPEQDLGALGIGDCTPCHGTLVDDIGDDHIIPTYAPSLVTPSVLDGSADETNDYGAEAGACNFCHLSQSINPTNNPIEDTLSGIDVYNNGSLHHNAGPYKDRQGNSDFGDCLMCHTNPNDPSDPFIWPNNVLAIRGCEKCHGYESLHNIQADSPNLDNPGEIVVGGEDYGYGHIGSATPGSNSDDCWGCHGFGFASTSAPATGPVTPTLSDSDKQVILAGTDTTITLSGSSLTNTSGTTEFVSTFTLTSQDGSVIVLPPEQITSSSATVVIPGNTVAGNYKLRAAKMGKDIFTWTKSNPLSVSIKEPLIIDSQTMSASCGECSGELTIIGSGFGDEADPILLQAVGDNIIKLNIVSWTDTKITATEADCEGSELTINGFSATN